MSVQKLPLPEVLEGEGADEQVAHGAKGWRQGGMVPCVQFIVPKVNHLNETREHGMCMCVVVCIMALQTTNIPSNAQ